MNLNNPRKDAAVNKLFVLINPAEIRKTGYITAVKHYKVFTDILPTELIEEVNRDIQADKLIIDRRYINASVVNTFSKKEQRFYVRVA